MPVSNSRDTILIERRYAAVFGTITDESIVALAGGVEEKLRDALAKVLALPAGAFAESATLAQKVRESMKSRKAYLDTGVLFGEAATDKAIDLLGDKSDDPSLEDLQTVIPSLIELYGLDAVRLMAVQYSTSLGGFRKLVSTDPRFAIPATQAATSATSTSQTSSVDAAAQEAKRKQRAERKQKDKEARSKADLQRRAARGRI
jgi:hypothetical protein